jgi:hypothetical protein
MKERDLLYAVQLQSAAPVIRRSASSKQPIFFSAIMKCIKLFI